MGRTSPHNGVEQGSSRFGWAVQFGPPVLLYTRWKIKTSSGCVGSARQLGITNKNKTSTKISIIFIPEFYIKG